MRKRLLARSDWVSLDSVTDADVDDDVEDFGADFLVFMFEFCFHIRSYHYLRRPFSH